MKPSKLWLAALCAASGAALGQTATLPSTNTAAVPTYESAGIYWQSPGGTAGCEVKYRRWGESAWRQGLSLWYDARDGQCRGSLVHLEPNTYYQVELNLPGQAATRGLVFKTWANQVPVARTIAVNSGGGTLNVAEGGSAAGYVVYQGASGAVLDGQNSATHNVTINASYVIVRGLALRGARQDAIRIAPNVHDVIIEDNDISGWGRTRDGRWGTDMDSAVRAVCSTPTLARVTVQRNRIHSPRYSANSWSDGHPAGPQAIAFDQCGGNHVFRHNEVFSGNGNYFNDIFGGGDNFSNVGFPNADSDIYGNRLSHAWDDGIEAEGANENVRIWGNYIDRTAIGIATTATSVGPVYMFRNVWNRSQMYSGVASLDQDSRQNFFKSGGTSTYGNGRRYVFHNTMLQARQPGLAYGLGGGFAMGGTGTTQPITNTWSMNNLYHGWKEGTGAMYQVGSGNNMSNDMFNGTPGQASIANFISGSPVYAAGHGWQSEAGGNYQLAPGSPGYGRGLRIANFNDGAASPDVGAHQSGTASMRFGLAGSSGSAASGGGAPTPAPPPGPAPTPSPGTGVWMSATSLGFPLVQSTQTVTYTNNTGSKVTFIQATMSSTRFGQTNTCGEVLPGASCTAAITYYPQWSGANSGTLTITSTAPNSPHVVSLAAGTSAPPSGGGGRLANISTRMQVLSGNDVLIGGFVIGGASPKTVVVRARGPSLAAAGVPNTLANPVLQVVRSSDGATIATNDNWSSAPNAAQISASGFAPSHVFESAVLMTLAPGAYTAIVTGAGGTTGVGMAEVFEVDRPDAPLANLSTRGQVRTGNDVMIGGFVVQGDGARTVVVRARGPSLAAHGIANALANPVLQLVRSSDGATLAINDNWGGAANAAQIAASGFAPADALEAAALVTLPPGAYTAIVTGAGGATGVGMIEVFAVP